MLSCFQSFVWILFVFNVHQNSNQIYIIIMLGVSSSSYIQFKVGRMEQSKGSFIGFRKNFDKKTPSLATKVSYLNQKIIIVNPGFIISLIRLLKKYMTSRAAQSRLVGLTRPVGHRLESPVLKYVQVIIHWVEIILLLAPNWLIAFRKGARARLITVYLNSRLES